MANAVAMVKRCMQHQPNEYRCESPTPSAPSYYNDTNDPYLPATDHGIEGHQPLRPEEPTGF